MKTSCFALYAGLGRISIARYSPRSTPAGFRIFKPLAPGDWAKGPGGRRWVDELAFDAGYAAQLAALDPQATWDRLHALAGDAEPVILCWEHPPFTAANRCHRRHVAGWFLATLGHQVLELDVVC